MKQLKSFIILLVFMLAGLPLMAQQTLILQRKADQGDKEAMYRLGDCYYYGNSEVRQDFAKAFYWYNKAASKNYVPAMRDVGLCYLNGTGVKPNIKKAWQYFEKAYKKGDAPAAYYMSQMIKDGMHGKKDDRRHGYLRQLVTAMEMGSEDAIYEWGMLHYHGNPELGIPVDIPGGESLILEAAGKGSPGALLFAGRSYLDGSHGVRRDPARAFTSFSRAVEMGNVDALVDLGVCYLKGIGTERDTREAYRCFDEAERLDLPNAARMLGDMYANGFDVTYNPARAMQYYDKAAAAGDRLADVHRAFLLLYGDNPDAAAAFRVFSDAAVSGMADGYAGMGDCYLGGLGVPQSFAKAKDNYNHALDKGSAHAAAQMGNMLYQGDANIARDYDKAMKYYRVFLADPYSVPRAVRAATYRRIAECYRFGRGVAQDDRLATEYTRRAYDDGETELRILLDE